MKTLYLGVSRIAMTSAERAAGRYMRAPDHPAGDGGGADGGGDGDGAAAPSGDEVNDEIEDTGTASGDRQPPATDADTPELEGEEGEEGADGQPKPKSDVQTRIDEITAGRREAEREAAEAAREAEYWRGVAEGRIKPDKPEGQGDEADQPSDGKPDPSNYQYGETDAAYISDLATFEARRAVAEEREQERVRVQLEGIDTSHQARAEAAKEQLSDYDEVVVAGAEKGTWSCTPLMSLGIKTSEYGPDVAYHLAKNPEESHRIAAMPPLEQAKQFGRLEYRFELEAKAKAESDGSGQGQDGKGNKVATDAPDPPPRARGSGGRFEVPADTADFAAFEQRADAVLGKKQRR